MRPKANRKVLATRLLCCFLDKSEGLTEVFRLLSNPRPNPNPNPELNRKDVGKPTVGFCPTNKLKVFFLQYALTFGDLRYLPSNISAPACLPL